jgi:hypothetical protein
VGFFSATFLGLLELLRSSFIATPKTSYTTVTLDEMGAEFVKNIEKIVKIERIE